MASPPRSLFVGGTASHAGKSWMTTAICAWLRRRGVRVAPFKAQNMSNNSFPLRGGGEIGRAQVAQAEACGLEPEADFNPILLKPDSDSSSQVIVNGRVWKTLRARDYYENFDYLLTQVLSAYERLASRYDFIVIEGAGSVTEMNLRATDLVNFGLATRVSAPALLVADIDRGGVFASITGTCCLLPPEERALLRSWCVNKFRGDVSLFTNGVEYLESRTGLPCLGVFPHARNIELDAEDAVQLDDAPALRSRIGILSFPRISNLTDFRLLRGATILERPVDRDLDVIFLPGTKATNEDLAWLRACGFEPWLREQHSRGAQLVGICGGYQMLGRRVGTDAGLGYLDMETDFFEEKTTVACTAESPNGHRFPAYEIHMGQTRHAREYPPFAFIDGRGEGVRANRLIGTYLHGALEDATILADILGEPVSAPEPKATHYDRLATWFEDNADTKMFEDLYLS